MEQIVLDTNILIEILKANQGIVKKLKSTNAIYKISSISVMELYFGALNKKELIILKKFVNSFEIVNINENISICGTDLTYKYAKSHGLHIADALIAATTLELGCKLFTLNIKDFHFIDNLSLL